MNIKPYKREWIAALAEARRLLVVTLRLLSNAEFKRLGTAGACPVAAFLLHATLLKHAPDCNPQIRFGYRQEGRCSHYWVQATDEDSQIWDLDVSADQFGDARLVYAPYDPQVAVYLDPEPISEKNTWMWRNQQTFEAGKPSAQERLDRVMTHFTGTKK